MKVPLIAALSTALAGPALAQVPVADMPFYLVPSLAARIETMPGRPRAKEPRLSDALQLARATVEACRVGGGEVSVLITDSAGVPVVILSGDGAGERGQLVTFTKAATVVKYKMASGDVFRKVKTDPKLAAEVRADPDIGAVRPGGFPLMSGGEMIGALAVVFTGTDPDCAQKAMAKVPIR